MPAPSDPQSSCPTPDGRPPGGAAAATRLLSVPVMTARPRVLLCDDAPGFRVLVETVLRDAGFDVAAEAATWADAERLATGDAFDAIVLDLWLPVFDRAAIARVRAACPGAVLAVISSLALEEVADLVDGIDGIDVVLSKRDAPDRIARALRARLSP